MLLRPTACAVLVGFAMAGGASQAQEAGGPPDPCRQVILYEDIPIVPDQSGGRTLRDVEIFDLGAPAEPVLPDEVLIGLYRTIVLQDDPGLTALLSSADCAEGACRSAIDENYLVHVAIERGTLGSVVYLLREGASVDVRLPSSGWTPLMTALGTGDHAKVALLLRNGANPDVAARDGLHAGVLAQLVGLDALVPPPQLKLSQEDANALLLRAIEAGSDSTVEQALEAGADPNALAANSWSALMIASFHGMHDAASLLIEAGAHLGYATPQGNFNAVHAAVIGNADEARWPRLKNVLETLSAAALDQSEECFQSVFGAATTEGITPLEIAKTHIINTSVLEAFSASAIGQGSSKTNDVVDSSPVEKGTAVLEDSVPEQSPEVLICGNGMVIYEELNLRAGPSSDFPILAKLHRGNNVMFLARDQDSSWIKVFAIGSKMTGWVNSRHVGDVSLQPATLDSLIQPC